MTTVEVDSEGNYEVVILNDRAGEDLRLAFPAGEDVLYLMQFEDPEDEDEDMQMISLTPMMTARLIKVLQATLEEKAA